MLLLVLRLFPAVGARIGLGSYNYRPRRGKGVAIEDIKAAEADPEAEKKEETHAYTGIKMSSCWRWPELMKRRRLPEAADGYSATINGERFFSDNTIVA